MPAKSQKQANLMRAAAHGATFPKAAQVRASMTKEQLADFAKMQPQHESYSYDFRSRNNLKRGKDK